MLETEITDARRAVDRLAELDPGEVAQGPLLEVLVNCRTLSKTADRLCDEQVQVPRRRA
jgi:hypothetical protein